jgi:hypothetical protein
MPSKVLAYVSIATLFGCSEQRVGHDSPLDASGTGGVGISSSGGASGASATGGALATGGQTGGALSTGGGGAGGISGGSGGTHSGETGGSAARDAATAGCDALPLCSTFEGEAVGAEPSGFTIVDPEMGGTADSATVDSIGANGSSRSLKVVSHGRIWARSPSAGGVAALGPSLHVHFFVRFGMSLPDAHVSFVALDVAAPRDDYDENNELRFGGQAGVFHWNNALSDRNVPSVSPIGNAASVEPAANTWYCVSLTIDKPSGHFSASVDGVKVAALTQDGVPTPDVDAEWLGDPRLSTWTASLVDVSFGFRSYGGGEATVWLDDVAVTDTPLPCP